MNKRIKNIVTVVLLAVFLFGFGAWAALKPADSLSLSERRRLKQLPAVRMDAVLSGKFMSDFEGYALDQFPLRGFSLGWYAFLIRLWKHRSRQKMHHRMQLPSRVRGCNLSHQLLQLQ